MFTLVTAACTPAEPGVTTVSTTSTLPPPATTTTTAPEPGSRRVTDDSGILTLRVPSSWTDASGIGWERGGQLIGPAVTASVNRDLWSRGWGTPGVFVGASEAITASANEVLDAEDFSADCTYVGRERYVEEPYGGQVDRWTNCGREGGDLVVAALRPPSRAFIILVQIILTNEVVEGAEELVLGSIRVDIEEPEPDPDDPDAATT